MRCYFDSHLDRHTLPRGLVEYGQLTCPQEWYHILC